MRKLALAVASALTLTACGVATTAAASATHPRLCAVFNVGFKDHGMEADAPVRICGLRKATYNCRLTKGTFGDPNERWSCTEARR